MDFSRYAANENVSPIPAELAVATAEVSVTSLATLGGNGCIRIRAYMPLLMTAAGVAGIVALFVVPVVNSVGALSNHAQSVGVPKQTLLASNEVDQSTALVVVVAADNTPMASSPPHSG